VPTSRYLYPWRSGYSWRLCLCLQKSICCSWLHHCCLITPTTIAPIPRWSVLFILCCRASVLLSFFLPWLGEYQYHVWSHAHHDAKLTFPLHPRLILRTYQVLSKPSEELISLLGLEVPIPPALSLAGIRADGVVLNWKAPDQQKITTVKHYIHINGVNGWSIHYFFQKYLLLVRILTPP
jgi:hypothetical protein